MFGIKNIFQQSNPVAMIRDPLKSFRTVDPLVAAARDRGEVITQAWMSLTGKDKELALAKQTADEQARLMTQASEQQLAAANAAALSAAAQQQQQALLDQAAKNAADAGGQQVTDPTVQVSAGARRRKPNSNKFTPSTATPTYLV